MRACWLVVEYIQRLNAVTSVLCSQLYLSIAASSLILKQFLTKQELPSVQDSKGYTEKKKRHFFTACIFQRFAVLFYATGRKKQKIKQALDFDFCCLCLETLTLYSEIQISNTFISSVIAYRYHKKTLQPRDRRQSSCIYLQPLFAVDIFKCKIPLNLKCMEVD